MFPECEWEILGESTPSLVSAQPHNEIETLLGAQNRAEYIRQHIPEADYWVGIEGGIQEHNNEFLAFAWVIVLSHQQCGKGRTGSFVLPEAVARWIRAGKELGEADDIVFERHNSKQDNGAVGILTGNVIVRQTLYEEAVILALIPFKNPDLYCV